MDIYLPTREAGKVRFGADARIVVDAYPNVAIPAKVSFVATQAQFTPKTVETAEEREKLMFRIRVKIDPDRLRARGDAVRSGLPGIAYIRTDPAIALAGELAAGRRAMTAPGNSVASLAQVTQSYGRTVALDDVTVALPGDCMVGLIGPDGVGKSSLLSMVAGARQVQSGARARPRRRHGRSGPSRRRLSAHRLYAAGTGQEPLSRSQRPREHRVLRPSLRPVAIRARVADRRPSRQHRSYRLCRSAAKKFIGRDAAETRALLLADPRSRSLILDEPTTGVDPLSRRQFWELIERMRARQAGMSIVVATAYMEEAERFDWLIAMNDGRVLAAGSPADIKARTGAATVEDAFVALMPEQQRAGHTRLKIPPRRAIHAEPVIVARDLTCRFGDFTAVDQVSFTIESGRSLASSAPTAAAKRRR